MNPHLDPLFEEILNSFAGVQLLPGELMQQQEDEDREVRELDKEILSDNYTENEF